MENIDITAGQLHMQNTTFMIEFYNDAKKEEDVFLARVYVSFKMWMSFTIDYNFILKNVNIGDPYSDYNITANVFDPSKLGKLRSDKDIMWYFQKAMQNILVKDYELNLYDQFFVDHPITKNLSPTFDTTNLKLVDRYFVIFLKELEGSTNLKHLMDALQEIG